MKLDLELPACAEPPPLAPIDLTPRVRDHRSVSSICTFARCRRLYFWEKALGLCRPSPTRDLAMDFGTAIHAAAPYTYGEHRGQALLAACDAFERTWGERDCYEDPKRNKARGRAIIEALMEAHAPGSRAYDPQEPELRSNVTRGELSPHEVTFQLDILPSAKPLEGRIDAMGPLRATGAIWAIEYKTASQMWSNFGDLWETSPQALTYITALEILGYSPGGIIVEGVLVDKRRTAVLPVAIDATPEKTELVLDWWQWIDRELSACETSPDPAAWLRCPTGCNPYACYGLQGFQCDFAPLCAAGDRWQELLGLYEQKHREEKEEVVE